MEAVDTPPPSISLPALSLSVPTNNDTPSESDDDQNLSPLPRSSSYPEISENRLTPEEIASYGTSIFSLSNVTYHLLSLNMNNSSKTATFDLLQNPNASESTASEMNTSDLHIVMPLEIITSKIDEIDQGDKSSKSETFELPVLFISVGNVRCPIMATQPALRSFTDEGNLVYYFPMSLDDEEEKENSSTLVIVCVTLPPNFTLDSELVEGFEEMLSHFTLFQVDEEAELKHYGAKKIFSNAIEMSKMEVTPEDLEMEDLALNGASSLVKYSAFKSDYDKLATIRNVRYHLIDFGKLRELDEMPGEKIRELEAEVHGKKKKKKREIIKNRRIGSGKLSRSKTSSRVNSQNFDGDLSTISGESELTEDISVSDDQSEFESDVDLKDSPVSRNSLAKDSTLSDSVNPEFISSIDKLSLDSSRDSSSLTPKAPKKNINQKDFELDTPSQSNTASPHVSPQTSGESLDHLLGKDTLFTELNSSNVEILEEDAEDITENEYSKLKEEPKLKKKHQKGSNDQEVGETKDGFVLPTLTYAKDVAIVMPKDHDTLLLKVGDSFYPIHKQQPVKRRKYKGKRIVYFFPYERDEEVEIEIEVDKRTAKKYNQKQAESSTKNPDESLTKTSEVSQNNRISQEFEELEELEELDLEESHRETSELSNGDEVTTEFELDNDITVSEEIEKASLDEELEKPDDTGNHKLLVPKIDEKAKTESLKKKKKKKSKNSRIIALKNKSESSVGKLNMASPQFFNEHLKKKDINLSDEVNWEATGKWPSKKYRIFKKEIRKQSMVLCIVLSSSSEESSDNVMAFEDLLFKFSKLTIIDVEEKKPKIEFEKREIETNKLSIFIERNGYRARSFMMSSAEKAGLIIVKGSDILNKVIPKSRKDAKVSKTALVALYNTRIVTGKLLGVSKSTMNTLNMGYKFLSSSVVATVSRFGLWKKAVNGKTTRKKTEVVQVFDSIVVAAMGINYALRDAARIFTESTASSLVNLTRHRWGSEAAYACQVGMDATIDVLLASYYFYQSFSNSWEDVVREASFECLDSTLSFRSWLESGIVCKGHLLHKTNFFGYSRYHMRYAVATHTAFVVFFDEEHYKRSMEVAFPPSHRVRRYTNSPVMQYLYARSEEIAKEHHLKNDLLRMRLEERSAAQKEEEEDKDPEEEINLNGKPKKKKGNLQTQINMMKQTLLFVASCPFAEIDFVRLEMKHSAVGDEDIGNRHTLPNVFNVQTRDYAFHYFSAPTEKKAYRWWQILSKYTTKAKEDQRFKTFHSERERQEAEEAKFSKLDLMGRIAKKAERPDTLPSLEEIDNLLPRNITRTTISKANQKIKEEKQLRKALKRVDQ